MIVETTQTKTSFTVVGSILAFILQVALAPHIAILDVVPNFILLFVVLNAIFNTQTRSCVTGFILGLLYDCISLEALGVMSFVLAIIAYVVSSFDKDLFANGWIIQAFFLLIAAFFGELFHAAFLSILGYDNDFLRSLGMRVIPGGIYEGVIGLIILPVLSLYGKRRRKDSEFLKGKLS